MVNFQKKKKNSHSLPLKGVILVDNENYEENDIFEDDLLSHNHEDILLFNKTYTKNIFTMLKLFFCQVKDIFL